MSGFIYIATRSRSTSGLVKIGHTDNLARRMGEFDRETGTDSSIVLEMAFECIGCSARDLEQAVHRSLASLRRRGEWFALSVGEAADKIAHCASGKIILTHSNAERRLEMRAAGKRHVEQAFAKHIAEGPKKINVQQVLIEARRATDERRASDYAQVRKRVAQDFAESYKTILYGTPFVLVILNAALSKNPTPLFVGAAGLLIGRCVAAYIKDSKEEAGFRQVPETYPDIEATKAARIEAAKAARRGEWEARTAEFEKIIARYSVTY